MQVYAAWESVFGYCILIIVISRLFLLWLPYMLWVLDKYSEEYLTCMERLEVMYVFSFLRL